MLKASQRAEKTVPFYAIEVLKQAQALAAQGRDIISLGVGEPDFTAPARVLETLQRAAEAGLSGYSAPAGIPALRDCIARYYNNNYGSHIQAGHVLVSSGASGALLLACMALINPGDEVLMADPSYPANQNFITAAGGITRLVACQAEHAYHLSAQDVEQHWGPSTRGVLLASPGNPTGTSMAYADLKALIAAVHKRAGFVIMDEIYLGLYYGQKPQSALSINDNVIIINSFSKYFHMTGWRLGWLIAPPAIMPAIERLAASLAICAPSLAQHAALSCFEPEVLQVYERRRLSFKERRDFLLDAFDRLQIKVPARPDGAFYVFADISNFGVDSTDFCHRLLHEAGVAAVPGIDFGQAHARQTVRFSYATKLDRLQEACTRMATFLQNL